MTDPLIVAALVGGVCFAVAVVALLRGWRDWIGLQRLMLDRRREEASPAGARIELADLRERVRKLELIAAGVEY